MCGVGRDGNIDDQDGCRAYCSDKCDGCGIQEAFDRLADYEDTGLTPEEVEALKAENKGLSAFKEYFTERYANDAIEPSYFEEAIEYMKKAEERSKENA